MHAGKRLLLATCAGLAIAAVLSGPAMADPGGPLSGVTETLPPALAEPVEDVGSTAEQLVEQVQAPVNGAVEDTTGLVDKTVNGVQETVDETVNGVQETVDSTLGTVQETVAPAVVAGEAPTSSEAPVSLSADPASVPETTAPPSAVSPALPPGVVSPAVGAESGALAPSIGREHVRSSGPAVAVERVDPTPTAAAVTGDEFRTAVPLSPNGVPEPAPLPPARFLGDSSIFGGSIPQPPSALIALLLGALALAAPRTVGRRLHPVVALPHPADMRFRLVRPG